MKAGQAPLRTFGDLKQFFDFQAGTDDSVDKKDLKKKKLKQEVRKADSVDEPYAERTAPKDSESTATGANSTAKPSSLQKSNKNVSEETLPPRLPDATAPMLEQQPSTDSSKDTSQQ